MKIYAVFYNNSKEYRCGRVEIAQRTLKEYVLISVAEEKENRCKRTNQQQKKQLMQN